MSWIRETTRAAARCRDSPTVLANPVHRRSIEANVMENERDTGGGVTCRELSDFLDDYLAGDLVAEVRSRFEAHLIECRDCVAYLRDYRETIRLLREAGRAEEVGITAEAPPELLRAIREARKRGP
jgi:anti-sigma factor RsiW